MSKHFGDDLRVHVAGEQQRGARMPEVVEADLRQSGALQERLELQLGDSTPVEWLSGLGGEYETVSIAGAPHREPTLSISASWRFRWLLRASVALLVSFTLRREPVVFGDVKTGPLLVMDSTRRTWREPSSRSTSSHFRPSSSP